MPTPKLAVGTIRELIDNRLVDGAIGIWWLRRVLPGTVQQ